MLSAVVVDAGGIVRATLKGETYDMVNGETQVLKASGQLAGARLWSRHDPYLYDVYSILTVGGKVVDVNKVRTGFRKTAFKGGAGTGGVYINDRFVYLKGYAQRVDQRMGWPRRGVSGLDARFRHGIARAPATATTCVGCTSPPSVRM